MIINITARNFKLTEGLTDNILRKLNKFEKFVGEDDKVNVVLESKKYGGKIEVFFNINGVLLKAESIDEDLYVAIDLVVDKLNKQTRRYNDKMNKNKKDSIRFPNEEPKILERDEEKSLISRRKVISTKPMFEEEAVFQMELLDHKSFMFFNADTEGFCMLYRRNEGDYGIIEVE